MKGRDVENIFELIEPLCVKIKPVGSRVTCNPPPTDTDQDYLLLAKWDCQEALYSLLGSLCFEQGGSEINDDREIGPKSEFHSFKHDDINLIVTGCDVFFGRFMAASSVAKRLNLMNKADRVALFQAVLYSNEC